MLLTAELAALNLDPAQQEGVVAAVLPLHAEAEKLRAQAKLDTLKIQALTLELAHLRRIRFGVKNEALSPEQRDLFRETADADSAAIEAEVEQQLPELRSQRQRAGRQPLPEHLPRIEHRHEPETCSCGQCGGELVKIGEDISEQLDVTPAKFFVHRHIRPQYACRPCERITAAPVPPAARVSSSALRATGAVPASTSAHVRPACPMVFVLTVPRTRPGGAGTGSTPRPCATASDLIQRLRYHSARPSRMRTPCTIPSPVNQWWTAGFGAASGNGLGPIRR